MGDHLETGLDLNLDAQLFEAGDGCLDGSSEFLEGLVALFGGGGTLEFDESGLVFELSVDREHNISNVRLV